MTYFSEPDFPDNLDDVWDVSHHLTFFLTHVFSCLAPCVGLVFAINSLSYELI